MKAKLIRDHLVVGHRGETRFANSLEGKYVLLVAKAHEELQEIAEEPRDPEEYADLLTVIAELARINNVSWESIEREYRRKIEERGGFRKGRIFIRAEEQSNVK